MSERKSDEKRIRRVKPEIVWTDLPADGNPAPVPTVPWGFDFGNHGLAYWYRAWASPASTQWGEDEAEMVARRCVLEDLFMDSLDRAGQLIETLPGKFIELKANEKVLPEMRYLEVALGRTAKARKELRWRIVDDVGEVVEARPNKAQRLRVVS